MTFQSIIKRFFLILVLVSCQQQSGSGSGMKIVSANEMEQLIQMEDVQIIDVRTKAEYESGHLFDAENIDVNSPEFEALIQNLDKDKPICVYCKSGGRSAKAAKILQEKGFKAVYDLEGGIVKWQKEGKEIQTAIPHSPSAD